MTAAPSGQSVTVRCATAYPADGEMAMAIELQTAERFSVAVRIPEGCDGAQVQCGGVDYKAKSGYMILDKLWQNGDTVTVRLPLELQATRKNGKTAFTFGALVLARDEAKEEGDITEEFVPERINGKLQYATEQARKGEQLRILLMCENHKKILLSDYASCGKNWTAARNRMTVWTNAR